MELKLRFRSRVGKYIVILLLAVLMISLLYFCFEGFLLDYINNAKHQAVYLNESAFTKGIGVASLEYESIQDAFGSADNRICIQSSTNPEAKLIQDDYLEFVAHYSMIQMYSSPVYNTYLITITGTGKKFGWLKIGIGCPRALVRFAFFLDQRISTAELSNSSIDYPDVDEGFYGDNWSRILFCYDENGFVKSIAYEPSAFY